MGVLNFAHGSLTMIGAFVGGWMALFVIGQSSFGVSLLLFLLTMVVGFVVLAGIGTGIEVGLIRRLYDRPPIYQILLTFGLTLVLDEIIAIIVEFYRGPGRAQNDWREPLQSLPAELRTDYFVGLSGLELLQIALGVFTVVGVWAFLNKTRYGLYVRAGSEDEEMAEALGIDVRRVFTVVFALGAGLAGAAGVLVVWDQSYSLSVPLAADVLLPAFVIVIIGGLGTFKGTVVASLIVGQVTVVTRWFFQNSAAIDFAGLPSLMIFLILVVMLLIRPQGLFGVEEVGGH
jgi:branched-chain amino acid transport system permease protein